MSWLIRVGKIGFAQEMDMSANARIDVAPATRCVIRSSPRHTFAHLSFVADGTAKSIPACHADLVWQHVLTKLVGI